MNQLFQRKPIADLVLDENDARSLKRVLGAGDLIMLAIGAVIGAGIFGAIGTAAAGQVGPNGEIIRYGAGPALVFSFILLGGACALAALCYAELAAMIPAGGQRLRLLLRHARRSRRVDHRLGPDPRVRRRQRRRRDLVGRLLHHAAPRRGRPAARLADHRLSHGAPQFEPRTCTGCSTRRRGVFGVPVLINVPAFGIVMLITWLLLRGARESVHGQHHHGGRSSCVVLGALHRPWG